MVRVRSSHRVHARLNLDARELAAAASRGGGGGALLLHNVLLLHRADLALELCIAPAQLRCRGDLALLLAHLLLHLHLNEAHALLEVGVLSERTGFAPLGGERGEERFSGVRRGVECAGSH